MLPLGLLRLRSLVTPNLGTWLASTASMKTMEGSVALVTGGAAGIGRATALAFAERGTKVVIADLKVEEGQELARDIESSGGNALFVRTDVQNAKEVDALVDATLQAYGRLDYAFNNAGIEGQSASTAECSEENFDRVLAVNLKGLWLCLRREIRQMLEQSQGGAIVNMSSVAGLVGFANLPAYVASKHAVVGLTKAAALEYAKRGIRINAVCPGVIHTEMIDRVTGGDPKIEQEYIDIAPMGRMGTPAEVASATLWLCSEGAGFVTGHALATDGGFVAG
jgi:NAD(P)-dependent dehydrogenase (short-subunit alcohol dehydrogenase family)